MNKLTTLITTAAVMTGLVGASIALGQRNYDLKTVETVHGKVVSVEKTQGGRRGGGLHLTLKTDKETIPVHLGPAGYMEKQAVQVAAGDTITVTGSRVMFEGKPALIAAQVQKGNDIMTLRDKNGVPAWSGAGRSR